MYWYYKLILLAIISAVLYGIFSAVSPYLPELPSFSSIEVKSEDKNEKKDTSNTVTSQTSNQVQAQQNQRSAVLKKGLSTSLQTELTKAKTLYKEHQRIDDAYNIAIAILDHPDVTFLSKGWYEVADFLSELNTKLFFSSAPSERKTNHVVKRGDSLARIAKNNTTITGLQRGNNIPLDSPIIHPGDVIRYFPGMWNIEAIKSEYILILYHNDQFFKYYKVGVGKENRTPEGKFLIYGKVIDPIWERQDGQKIAPGSPENVLGTRWMKLRAMEGTEITGSGYGIHGTTEPNSIGTPASQGCIRMRNEDIEELFDIIPDVSVEVLIRK